MTRIDGRVARETFPVHKPAESIRAGGGRRRQRPPEGAPSDATRAGRRLCRRRIRPICADVEGEIHQRADEMMAALTKLRASVLFSKKGQQHNLSGAGAIVLSKGKTDASL